MLKPIVRLSAVLLACAALIFLWPGCGDTGETEKTAVEPMIRLAARDRLDRLETNRWDLLRGLTSLNEKDLVFEDLGKTGPWFPFHYGVELGSQPPGKAGPLPQRLGREKDGALAIPSRTGLACVVPVPANRQIVVECKGSFGSKRDLQVEVVRLAQARPLPVAPKDGLIKAYLNRLGDPPILLPSEMKSDLARGKILTTPETQALLILVFSAQQKEGRLEYARLAMMDDTRKDQPPDGTSANDFLEALVADRLVENTLQRCLWIPLGSRLTFKKLMVPENAELHCTLNLPTGAWKEIKVTLTGRDEEGEHEIFTWRPTEDADRVRSDIRRDLSHLAGRELILGLACEATGAGAAAKECISMVACGAPVISSRRAARAGRMPNLILVCLDTLRWDRLGCYGYPRPISPNIDALAGESLRFNRVYAHAPFTLPSHASLFTGLMPSVHGAMNNQGAVLPSNVPVMAEILARHGWQTASFNGSGFVSHEFGFDRGFDRYCEVDPLGDRFVDHVVDAERCLGDGSEGSLQRAFSWIESMQEQPFFLFLHTYMVHDYLPPENWAEAFRTEAAGELPLSKNTRQLIRKKYVRGEGVDPESLAYLSDMYDGTVRATDEMVGELLAHLETLGLRENTLLIVTSDHGEEFLEHDNIYHALTLYDEMIRLPFILNAPWLEGGREINAYVNQVDILPTLLDMLEVPCDQPMQGRSFTPCLADPSKSWQARVYAEVDTPSMARRWAVITDGWKFIEGDTDESLFAPAPAPVELFRIESDPGEKTDLSGGEREQIRKMTRLMQQVKDNNRLLRKALNLEEGETSVLSPEMEEFLKQHGYL